MWALLTLALVFGAGGSPSPIGEGLAIAGSLVVMAIWVWSCADRFPMPVWHGTAIIAALPLLAAAQLVPMLTEQGPAASVRAPMAQALGLVRSDSLALPISIDPASTMWALLALLPPLVAFVLASNCRVAERAAVLRCIVVLAICSAILQAAQLIGTEQFFLHPRSIDAGPSGFFANQNTQALFLAVGILAAMLLSRPNLCEKPLPLPATAACIAFLAVSCALTGSRAGLALMALALVYPAFTARRGQDDGKRTMVLFSLLAVGGAAFLLLGVRSSIVTIERFGDLTGGRVQSIWPDTLYLLRQTWPLGSGIGTFPVSFELVERLDVVDPTFANRAHSDWLEFLIEGGVAAVIIIAGGCLVAIRKIWQYRQRDAEIGSAFGLGVLVLVGLHATIDYPLRAIAMAVIAAIAWAWFAGRQIETEVPS